MSSVEDKTEFKFVPTLPEPEVQKGYISREHTVWCGVCGNWEQVAIGTVSGASKEFKQMGWKKTRARGWVCPKCLDQIKKKR